MAILWLLAGGFLLGLVLLVIGAVLLFKVKSKVAGLVLGAVGLLLMLLPLASLLFLMPIRSAG